VPDPPSLQDDGEARPTPEVPPPDPTPPQDDGPLVRPRWGMAVFVPLTLTNPSQFAASDELRPAPTLGLGIRGHGYLGSRRRVMLGGEAAATAQPLSGQQRHRMKVAWVGLTVGFHQRPSHGRWELGVEGVVGLGTQTLMFDGEDRLRCAANEREASRRSGLWAGTRVYAAAMLGKRRNHALTFRLGPGVGVFAAGSVAEQDAEMMTCEGEPSAFERFGVQDGGALVIAFDVGYSPRF
jgi:hypothetical protein